MNKSETPRVVSYFFYRLLVLFCCLLTGAALAQSPVSLAINTGSPGLPIAPDFGGFSFETGSLHYDHYRPHDYFFDSSNARLLMLFKNLGITSIRIGGNSVDRGFVPSTAEIDAFFRFAKVADVKVIYSLRLANGDPSQDASIAKYVWNNYRPCLISLAIGNEANSYKGLDPQITNCASFIAKWNRFAAAVTDAVPDVILGGPDNGNGATSWAADFARAEQGNNRVTSIFSHYEAGGPGRNKSAAQIINEMLSPAFDDERYPSCCKKIGELAQSLGFSYRFTEANTHVAPIKSSVGNHSFATALFALDFMYWWAAHGCMGVQFHTGAAGFNAAFCCNTNGHYEPYPICYGIAAFNVGGHGVVDSMKMENPDHLNLTAYAVTDTNNNLFVTIINKEHGKNARSATVTIDSIGHSSGVMFLKAPNDNVTDTYGITLGGASISDSAPWQGQWSALDSTNANGCAVTIDACSAAIVKFTGAGVFAPNTALQSHRIKRWERFQ